MGSDINIMSTHTVFSDVQVFGIFGFVAFIAVARFEHSFC